MLQAEENEPLLLESGALDVRLVELLARAYVVTVWAEGGKVFYRLTGKPGLKGNDV